MLAEEGSLTPLITHRITANGVAPGLIDTGFIEGVDRFDPLFFNISPREAEYMDPQQRVFLQACWLTIEHAGGVFEDQRGDKLRYWVDLTG